MKVDILQDLSILTSTPKVNYSTLTNRVADIIAHTVCIGKSADEMNFQFDIGIGTIIISIDSEEIHYKFVPTEDLAKKVSGAVEGEDTLVKQLEENLAKRILKTYKDI